MLSVRLISLPYLLASQLNNDCNNKISSKWNRTSLEQLRSGQTSSPTCNLNQNSYKILIKYWSYKLCSSICLGVQAPFFCLLMMDNLIPAPLGRDIQGFVSSPSSNDIVERSCLFVTRGILHVDWFVKLPLCFYLFLVTPTQVPIPSPRSPWQHYPCWTWWNSHLGCSLVKIDGIICPHEICLSAFLGHTGLPDFEKLWTKKELTPITSYHWYKGTNLVLRGFWAYALKHFHKTQPSITLMSDDIPVTVILNKWP